MIVTHVDFETRSRADLKVIGGRRYAEHPSTDVICAVLRSPAGDLYEWAPGYCDPWQGDAPAVVCAHNAINFDRHIWHRLGWPEPERWVDTAELAKVGGYPSAKLEWLGEHLLGAEKDMAGNALTLALSKPAAYYGSPFAAELAERKLAWRAANKGNGLRLPTAQLAKALAEEWDTAGKPAAPVDPATLERVIAYCRKDVEIMAGLLDEHLGVWLDCDVPGLEEADRALNDRGVYFDRDLAALLIAADECLGEQALERAGVDVSIVKSPAKLVAALAALGVTVENCQADTLEDALAVPGLPVDARRLIEARQACSSIASGKLKAGLARVSEDGRLRDNRIYMGAHTGRWAGKGFQMDNMAKGL